VRTWKGFKWLLAEKPERGRTGTGWSDPRNWRI
jgi:hypothetical protein